MKIEDLYKLYLQYPSVQTDTRKLQQGDIFFALKGPNFNGNAFAQQAIDAGAVCAVIDDKDFEIPHKTFLVEDVLTTLQQLAHYHRKQFHIPFIAITGSNGKTTTKELIHAVLSEAYTTYTTAGNLNNHIGVPLTILKIKPDAEMAVIEMGANHLQEIESYCKIAEPNYGLITNCGKAHLEGFGSVEGVKKAKGELFDYLRQRQDGRAFVMWDYDYLRQMSDNVYKIIKYGTAEDVDYRGEISASEPFLSVKVIDNNVPVEIHTKLVGDYNLPNVLAAVAVGRNMMIGIDKIKRAIESYEAANSRSQLISTESNTIILDAYNANPGSMKLAIENFARMSAEKKILVLGAMAEMGDETITEHEQLIKLIEQYKWSDVILVGKAFEPYKHLYKVFENAEQATTDMEKRIYKQTWFFVKGSRSSRMEKVLPAITKS